MKRVTVILAAIMLVSGAVFAQTDIGLYGIGGGLGFVFPGDIEGDNAISFHARADLGTISTFGLLAEIMYWSVGEDVGYYEWSWSQLYITALAKKQFGDVSKSFVPYGAAGLGIIIGGWDSKYTGPNTGWDFDADGSDTDIAIHIKGGVDFKVSDTIKGYAEAFYALGGFDTFGIQAGVMFPMGK